MKTTLLAFLCMALFSFTNAFAQPCDLSTVQVENVYTGTDGNCYADVYFDMKRNNGNSYVYLHIWTKADFSKVDQSKFINGLLAPKFSAINGTGANLHPALATVVINNHDNTNPEWNTAVYSPDASVTTVKGESIQVSGTPVSGSGSQAFYRYNLKAVPLGALGEGCKAENLGIIVWSTQSNSANAQIHCSPVEPSAQQALLINGMVQCATNKYILRMTNTTSKAITGSIDLYAVNSNKPNAGPLDLDQNLKFDAINYFIIEPNQTLNINRAIPDSYVGLKLVAQVVYTGRNTHTAELLAASCGTLPVVMKAVSATRVKQQVSVKWQTASEQNVKGFTILRKTDETGWKAIGFVSSQAADGFSSQNLAYQFMDVSPVKGMNQYRIEEVSRDGKTTLSEVRMVRGEELASKLTIYPNPTTNGKAVLVFDNAALRDIIVSDVSGRIVKQIKGITASNVAIDQLNNGFYNVQVIDRSTSETTVTRLMVRN